MAALKKLCCRVYICFRVLVIKLISMIFNERKQQRPVISTIVDSYASIAQIFDSLKIQNVSNFHFEERAAKKK